MNPFEQLLQRKTPVKHVAQLLQGSRISKLNADSTIIVNRFWLERNALVTLRHRYCISQFHAQKVKKDIVNSQYAFGINVSRA